RVARLEAEVAAHQRLLDVLELLLPVAARLGRGDAARLLGGRRPRIELPGLHALEDREVRIHGAREERRGLEGQAAARGADLDRAVGAQVGEGARPGASDEPGG